MTTFYATLAHLTTPTVVLIFTAATAAIIVAWGVGGDREDAEKRGTYDAGTAREVQP